MPVHPLPPYSLAPPSDGLTPLRLWFLCLVAGFTREQIGVLTGTSAEAVYAYQLKTGFWRHDDEQDASPAMRRDRVWAVAEGLGVLLPQGRRSKVATGQLRRRLREALVEERITWREIDALPFSELVRPR